MATRTFSSTTGPLILFTPTFDAAATSSSSSLIHGMKPARAGSAGWAFRAPYPTDGYVWTIGNNSSVDATGRLTKTILQQGRVRRTQAVPLPFPIRAGQEYHVETDVVGSTMTTTVSTTATNQQFTDVSQDATYARGGVGFVESTADSALARF